MDANSILGSIKKQLGLNEHQDNFDQDIIMLINSAFTTLEQLGLGQEEGFSIKSEAEKWSDFIDNINEHEWVKVYVFLKVKLVFDPPLSSTVIEMMKEQIREYEWRINVKAENKEGN